MLDGANRYGARAMRVALVIKSILNSNGRAGGRSGKSSGNTSWKSQTIESVNRKKYILIILDDYSRFTWVKCLRSKDEASNFIIKFLKMIQVRLKTPVRHIRTDNRTEFFNQTLRKYYEKVGISHETSVARSPEQNGVNERRNRKTPYEHLHNKLPNLSFLHVFGALCYPTNDSENLGKLQPKADIGIFIGYAPTKKAFWIYNKFTRRIVETIHVDFDELTVMASEQSSSGPTLNEMTNATISLGLVPKPSSSTPYVSHSRNDWDLLFQPLFDELLTPLPSVDPPALEVIALIANTTPKTQSSVIPQDVEEDIHDIKIAHMGNDLLFVVPIPKVSFTQSLSTVSPHTIVQPYHQIPQHKSKWKNDHPLDNIIDQLSRPVSTRLQLYEQALLCYYDAFLTSVEPKTYKDALTQTCWIKVMQEELNEFERLEKYGFESCDPVDTPMVEKSRLDKDKERKAIDPSHYRGGTVNRGLWYPKDSSIALTVFADADHAGCQDTRRSTSGSLQFLRERLIS
uniref:Integrase catalytic domain-containing protein n=1 Tax=Tanacetum cinerariifolium TaxID=118510 RepID=A0A6L2J2T7_TANCI|nr:hypothetical protein [Tanacetum cinerariifolium]